MNLKLSVEKFSFKNIENIDVSLYSEFMALSAGLKPLIQTPEIAALYLKKFYSLAKDLNLYISHRRVPKGISRTPYFKDKIKQPAYYVYITKNKTILKRALACMDNYSSLKISGEFPWIMGELFGYPPCCIRFHIDFPREKGRKEEQLPFGTYKNTLTNKGRFTFLLKNQNQFYHLISHFPCRYDCQKSLDYAKRLLDLIDRVGDKRWLRELIDFLKTPGLKIFENFYQVPSQDVKKETNNSYVISFSPNFIYHPPVSKKIHLKFPNKIQGINLQIFFKNLLRCDTKTNKQQFYAIDQATGEKYKVIEQEQDLFFLPFGIDN